MGFSSWADAKVRRLDWVDIALVKVAVVAFTLAVARRWRPVLEADERWYVAAFVLAAARPLYRAYLKRA